MHEKFIARQPIFDKRLRVYAYELLFRGGPQNFFQPRNHAASSVIADSLTLFDLDRKSTRLNSSHQIISYAVFCLKKKKKKERLSFRLNQPTFNRGHEATQYIVE